MRVHSPLQAASTAGSFLFLNASQRRPLGVERRRSRRVPKSIGISVQPLDQNQCHIGNDFFAITRDISKGGLAFICPRQTTYEMAALSLEDDPSRIVVARVCNCNLLHANEFEEVYLTSVEFLYERRT